MNREVSSRGSTAVTMPTMEKESQREKKSTCRNQKALSWDRTAPRRGTTRLLEQITQNAVSADGAKQSTSPQQPHKITNTRKHPRGFSRIDSCLEAKLKENGMTSTICDKDGCVLEAGDFVEILESRGNVLSGPVKFEGCPYCGPIWSIAGYRFATSYITSDNIRKLPWRRWRNPQQRFTEFWEFSDNNREARRRSVE